MPDQYRSGDKFHDISAIDSRLADLEQEKQQLIALRAELQKAEPVPPVVPPTRLRFTGRFGEHSFTGEFLDPVV